MIATGSTFYATYADIRDALLSAKQRISKEFLLDFLSSRGVLIAGDSSREELIEAVAGLTHAYSDFEEIYAQLEVVPRPERVTSRALATKIDTAKLQKAVEAIRAQRKDYHEAINLVVAEGGGIKIKVEYSELDHGKTLLRQRRARESGIEVYKVGEQLKLRYPASHRVEEIVDSLVTSLEAIEEKSIRQEVIDLSLFDKEKRTLFFKSLLSGLSTYDFVDVIKVAVDNEIATVDFIDSDSDSDEDSPELDTADVGVPDVDDDSAAEVAEFKAEVAAGVQSFLKSAALDGTGVLHSKELTQFLESGFFISKVIWQAKHNIKNGVKVELEAMLENPSCGTGFRYSVKGYYPCRKDGSHTLTRRQAKDAVKKPILDVIENAAIKAYREHAAATTNVGDAK